MFFRSFYRLSKILRLDTTCQCVTLSVASCSSIMETMGSTLLVWKATLSLSSSFELGPMLP